MPSCLRWSREYAATYSLLSKNDIVNCRLSERDAALANVAQLASELAVLREVIAKRDRLFSEMRELQAEHQAAQLLETKAELKNRTLQGELLALARQELTGGKVKV